MKTFLFLFCCAVCSAQQTTVSLSFFGAQFNKQITYPGIDTTGKAAILGGVRLWDNGVKWSQVETGQQVYNWKALDSWVSKIEAGGQDVLYTFGATPQFAASNSPKNCLPPDQWSCAVPNETDWKDFVTAIVTRYKGRIRFYELWNEPDYKGFFSGTMQQLSVMCTDAAAIIREIDPAATLLSPSFHGPTMPTAFRALVQAQKPALMFDVVNVHMRGKPNYPPENFLTVWGQVTSEMSTDQILMPVWDDEHGILPSDNQSDPDVLASYVARELLLRASVPLQRQYIYNWETINNTPAATASNVVTQWLLLQATTKVRIQGTVYTVHVGKGAVVWDSSQTCSGGNCTAKIFPLGKNKFKTQTDLSGAVTPIVKNAVQLGLKPIYLQ